MRSPKNMVDDKRMMVIASTDRLDRSIKNCLNGWKNQLAVKAGKLQALSPLAVIFRGYSAIYDQDNAIVISVNDVNKDDTVKLLLSDGELQAKITDIAKKRKKRTVSNEREKN